MVVSTRSEAEKLLAKALSRHIGYTSGAYDLGRIVSTIQPFADRTSAYKDELVSFLGNFGPHDHKSVTRSPDYLADIISFATSMGLLEAVSPRDAKLTRYACTELGRSLLGAQAVNDGRFFGFYLAQVVLRSDADFILPILLYISDEGRNDLIVYFLEFEEALRERRLRWLQTALPERVLFERVASQVPWLKRSKSGSGTYDAEVPTLNTARHHATPRNGWIEQLGMYDKGQGHLTDFGVDVVRALAPAGDFFWLAPPQEALHAMGWVAWPPGQSENVIQLRRGVSLPSSTEIAELIEEVARVMTTGFGAAKLVHASQASLQLPIEYINYRAYVDKRAYEWAEVLDSLFQAYRTTLQRFSARKGKVGFYRVVGK